MIHSAQDRTLCCCAATGGSRAITWLSSVARAISRWGLAALGLLAAAAICPMVRAQTAAPQVQVRAEFRRPPRALITQTIDRSRTVRTAGAVSSAIAGLPDLGEVDGALPIEHIQLLLQRTPERQAAFDALVEAQHTQGNPSFHQWLTPELVGSQFGPSASDLATLVSFLRGEGFTVENTGKSGLYVDFSGTAAQVSQTFHTAIHNLRTATGEVKFSPVADASIPEALAPLVAGFVSLSNISPAHPTVRKSVAPARGIKSNPALPPSPFDDVSSTNYAVGPQDFYTIYNESPLLTASTPINGSGVTIALLEESAINTADIAYFRNLYGVPALPPGQPAVDNGYGSNSCTAPAQLNTGENEEGEAILDIQWAGSVAPGANLIFMQCASTDAAEGILLSAQAVIDNNLADIMSLSYGQLEGADSMDDAMVNDLWEQAASQGETVVVSAGDSGADTEDDGAKVAIHGITASSFSTTAWNVSAGGTDFQDTYNGDEGDSAYDINTFWGPNGAGLGSAKSYIPETTWNDTCASSLYNAAVEGPSANGAKLCGATTMSELYLAAGGSAPSTLYTRPSWQTGTVYGLPMTSAYPNRLQPDVSLFASNGWWDHDLPLYQSDVATPLSYAGGTSFVAPQLAGVFALIMQATGERLGQPDYVLYNMAGQEFGINTFTGGSCNGSGASGVAVTSSTPGPTCIFYDIQTGNNSVDCVSGTTDCFALSGKAYGILSTSKAFESPAFATNEGWDQATGIGSFNITNLVDNWQTSSGGVLFTPTVAVTTSSASYTYGFPSAITYTATVSGSGSFPTGSLKFSGSPPISTIGTDPLAPSSGCSAGTTCTESATQGYTPPGTLAGGSYSITGTYSSTNESYSTGSGTATLTVNPQTPTVTVGAVTIGFGTATANLSANVAYTGSGAAPAGGFTFKVDSGIVAAATCTGSSSPLTCTYSGYNTSTLAVGTHTITGTSLTDGNYATATGSNTLTVMTVPTIVFTVPTHHTMDAPFAVSASSNSAGVITYSVMSGPATMLGSMVTLTGAAGTVVLQAAQAANGIYAAGSQYASFSVIAGSAWLGNGSVSGSLSAFDLTGAPITGTSGFTGGGVGTIGRPLGLAFDSSGNVWVASSNGVSEFSRQGVAITTAAYTNAGISNPSAVAVDGSGQIWVANANGSVSVLSNTGAVVSPSAYPGPGSTPAGIAIDIAGSVWIPSRTANTVTRILGAAAPVVPLATGAANGPGGKP